MKHVIYDVKGRRRYKEVGEIEDRKKVTVVSVTR